MSAQLCLARWMGIRIGCFDSRWMKALLRLAHYHHYTDTPCRVVTEGPKRTVIRRVESLKWAGWHAALANWNFWCGHWYVTSAYGCPAYVRISEFSQLLDDHGMFRSIRVINDIHLHLFGMCKGPGWREGRVRCGNDFCYRCSLSMHRCTNHR